MGTVHKQIGKDGNFEWEGIEIEPYQGGGASEGSCRHVIIGPTDGAHNFAMRYFEIPPGGQSSFEHHLHDQGIMIMKGRARKAGHRSFWDGKSTRSGPVMSFISPSMNSTSSKVSATSH